MRHHLRKKNNFYFLFILLFTYSCNNLKSDECKFEKEKIKYEYNKGNKFFIPIKGDNSNVLHYKLFKKYGIIKYTLFNPLSSDSCQIEKIKELLIKENIQIDSITYEIKKHDEKMNGLPEIINYKYYDGLFHTPNIFVEYPILIDDPTLIYKRVKKKLNLKENYHFSSRFWIVIDTLGNIKNIETYVKDSKLIDNSLKDEIEKTKWEPSKLLNSSTHVEVRIIW